MFMACQNDEKIWDTRSYNVVGYSFSFACSKQFMEVIKLESMGHYREDMIMPSDIFLLQVSNLSLVNS